MNLLSFKLFSSLIAAFISAWRYFNNSDNDIISLVQSEIVIKVVKYIVGDWDMAFASSLDLAHSSLVLKSGDAV